MRFQRTRLFVVEGQSPPVWQLVLYPPILAATGAVIILTTRTLLRILGIHTEVYSDAPYSIGGLVLNTVDVSTLVLVIVVGTWAWQRFARKRNMASLGLERHEWGQGNGHRR
jgi:hypothetical protein